MQEYIVQSGDTLSAIAIGEKLVLPIGSTSLEVVMVKNTLQGVYPANRVPISLTTVGSDLIAKLLNTGQQERVATTKALGLYRLGIFKLRDFMAYEAGLLQQVQISPSEIKIMLVTSANEGSLDAINTWDSQFLSFGIFQWTLGSAGQQGELPALLNNFKKRYPSEFHYYFGQFGLDASSIDGITGWLSLNGKRLVDANQKNMMRDPLWALRFAIAGMDALLQSVQVVHAISRLDRFYFTPTPSLQGLALSQLLSSEFAVSLILDHHVNRPSHVIPCVAEAIARSGFTPAQVAQGSIDREALIIENYLTLRETFGGSSAMTKSRDRAELAKQAIGKYSLSMQRFSFRSNRQSRLG
jgi:hypothetical protein